MNKKQIEQRVRHAFDALTPTTDFEDIRRQATASPPERSVKPMTADKTKKSTYQKIIRFAAPAVAACLVLALAIGGVSYHRQHMAVDAVIDFDVNPGVELKINKQEKVLSAEAVNDEGAYVLDNMELKNTSLDVAVNALIGSMFKKGYVVDNRSSILISVQHQDEIRARQLREQIATDVDTSLAQLKVAAPVINQTVTEDEATRRLAETHGISIGKAAFVHNLATQDASLQADKLAAMSVRQLTQLVVEMKLDIRQFADYDEDDSVWENVEEAIEDGNEAAAFRITPEQAKTLAVKHAAVGNTPVTFRQVERDEEDGAPYYEIEFAVGSTVYEYAIHGVTGQVLKSEKEPYEAPATTATTQAKPTTTQTKPTTTQAKQTTTQAKPTGLITANAAKTAALKHAGLTANQVVFEDVELDHEDSIPYYEVEFQSGNMEYSYEIHAHTGQVLEAEKEIDD